MRATRTGEVRKAAVVKMINTVQPDVVGLQEPRTEQRTYLKNNLPNYGYLEVPGTGAGTGGNHLPDLSSGPLHEGQRRLFLPQPDPDEPSRCWDVGDSQWRTSVWVHLKEKETGKEFFFLSTHMPVRTNSSYPNEPHIQARINSANLNVERMKKIAGESAMCFIVGDMNCAEKAADGSANADGVRALKPYRLDEIGPRHRSYGGCLQFQQLPARERPRRAAISTISSTVT